MFQGLVLSTVAKVGNGQLGSLVCNLSRGGLNNLFHRRVGEVTEHFRGIIDLQRLLSTGGGGWGNNIQNRSSGKTGAESGKPGPNWTRVALSCHRSP